MTTWKLPFSINRIAHMMIPHRNRQTRMIAWVKVFVSYLVYIKEMLYSFWDKTWLDVSITPQVTYLEKILNLTFNRTDIWIGDGFSLGPWVFTKEQGGSPEFYMDQETISWVYTHQDASECDFVVHIPDAIADQASHIAALVHRHKLPGKRFIIQKDV